MEGHKVFWKIDCYAPDMMHGSEKRERPEGDQAGAHHHAGVGILTPRVKSLQCSNTVTFHCRKSALR